MIWIDIDMPKTCGQCFCAMKDYDYNTVRCRFKYDLCFDANSRDYSNRRLDGCPLHEVTDSDTVSRQAVRDAIRKLPIIYINGSSPAFYEVDDINHVINDLSPSPSRPYGHWIRVPVANGLDKYRCDKCGHYVTSGEDKNFCPNCGNAKNTFIPALMDIR